MGTTAVCSVVKIGAFGRNGYRFVRGRFLQARVGAKGARPGGTWLRCGALVPACRRTVASLWHRSSQPRRSRV